MSNDKNITVAIDGPAGSGKSTISKILSQKLGYTLVDTGALYRCVALLLQEKSIQESDEAGIKDAIASMSISFAWKNNENHVFMNEEDVSKQIRTLPISQAASRISALPVVRQELLTLQRTLAGNGSAVLEGRDIGTVVFPQAQMKFFLDAKPQERAKRRLLEIEAQGKQADYEHILKEIKERDDRDSQRDIAPLKAADDAIIVDSTSMTIEQVVDMMLQAIQQKELSS